MLSITKIQILLVLMTTVLLSEVSCGTVKRNRGNRDRDQDDDENDSSGSASTEQQTPVRIKSGGIGVFPDYAKRLEGLQGPGIDPISSSQNISPAIAAAGYSNYNNPFLLNGQANLQNNPALLYQNGGVGLGLQNPLAAGAGGLGAGLGGINNFEGQSPYNLAAIQSLLLQQQQQQGGQLGIGGLGGFGGGLYNGGGLYSQQAGLGVGGLYNQYNPLLGGGFGGAGAGYLGSSNLGGIGGINPYLQGGRIGGILGQNYLAQSLLSPYNSYNQINPYSSYPFSARFGVGRGSSSSSGRINSSSNSNNDE